MDQICLMRNTIQEYAWGSRSAIAELLGRPVPSNHPQAELWMGAHPKAPSQVRFQGRWQALDRLITRNPEQVLGRRVSEAFGGRLPFLFKVLAAERPLSVQAHPDKFQAREGFERENSAGIALDAAHRNYRDDRHKPECLCALTPFWGLCGFRPPDEMLARLKTVWPTSHRDALKRLESDGIRNFFQHLMTLAPEPAAALVGAVVKKAATLENAGNAPQWVIRLSQAYGSDIGVLAPLLLNIVALAPGQAIYLPAGQLHAYLNGAGIELMANSDNVLRGGLTAKHVDVTELLRVLDFSPYRPEITDGRQRGASGRLYRCPVEEFKLTAVQVSPDQPFSSGDRDAVPEILLCTGGNTRVQWHDGRYGLDLAGGRSAYVPAGVPRYSVTGAAKIFRASVNLSSEHGAG